MELTPEQQMRLQQRMAEQQELQAVSQRLGVGLGDPLGGGYNLNSLWQVYTTRRNQGVPVGDFGSWVNTQLASAGAGPRDIGQTPNIDTRPEGLLPQPPLTTAPPRIPDAPTLDAPPTGGGLPGPGGGVGGPTGGLPGPGGSGGDQGGSLGRGGGPFASWGYTQGPNGELLPLMLGQGASPYQNRPRQEAGTSPWHTSPIQLERMLYNPDAQGYQWFQPGALPGAPIYNPPPPNTGGPVGSGGGPVGRGRYAQESVSGLLGMPQTPAALKGLLG